jgi:hypothetical protein
VRSEGNAGEIKPKVKEENADAKPNIQKEQKGKSKNKKDGAKLQNVRSQTEGPKGNLHSEVLVLNVPLHWIRQKHIFDTLSYSTHFHVCSMLT